MLFLMNTTDSKSANSSFCHSILMNVWLLYAIFTSSCSRSGLGIKWLWFIVLVLSLVQFSGFVFVSGSAFWFKVYGSRYIAL